MRVKRSIKPGGIPSTKGDRRGRSLRTESNETIARHYLNHLEEIPQALKGKKWRDLLILAEYAAKDAPLELAQSDPALYRRLRGQISEYRIRGWHLLNIKKLRELILAEESQAPKKAA